MFAMRGAMRSRQLSCTLPAGSRHGALPLRAGILHRSRQRIDSAANLSMGTKEACMRPSKLPPAAAGFQLTRLPKKYPFLFGVVLATTKTGLADIGVQKYIEGRKEIDWRRVKVFALFGFAFCGVWQYALFVKFMPWAIPGAEAFAAKSMQAKLADGVGMRGVLVQCFVENGINNPFIYFPIFYSIKSLLEGVPEGSNIFSEGISKYKKNWTEDIPAIWALWVPAQMFNFGFSPMWLRVPFVAVVSALWTIYVSATRGAPEEVALLELEEGTQ